MRIRPRADRVRAGADAGMTMIEVTVTMVVMAVVMSVFTTAIVGMLRSANRTDTLSNAQSQLNLAFIRLDKEIRYAAGISKEMPAGADKDWYIEYLTTNTGTRLCTELRLHVATHQLQRRTWIQPPPPVTPGSVTPTAWIPLASNVSNPTQPFTFLAADKTTNFQRLALSLTAGTGSSPATSRHTEITFTALDTSLNPANPSECNEARAIP